MADFLRIWQTLSFFLHVKCGFPTETGGDSNYNKTFFFSVFFSDFFFSITIFRKKKTEKKNQNSYQVCISLGIWPPYVGADYKSI